MLARPVQWQIVARLHLLRAVQQASRRAPRPPLAVRYAAEREAAVRYLRAPPSPGKARRRRRTQRRRRTSPPLIAAPAVDRSARWRGSRRARCRDAVRRLGPQRRHRAGRCAGHARRDARRWRALWRDDEGTALVRRRRRSGTRPHPAPDPPADAARRCRCCSSRSSRSSCAHLFAPPVPHTRARARRRLCAAYRRPAVPCKSPRDLQPWLLLADRRTVRGRTLDGQRPTRRTAP